MKSISLVDVANATSLQFANTEVLLDNAQMAERKHELFRAMLLNCIEHQPVKIFVRNNLFEFIEVESHGIALTDKHVMLIS